MRTNIPQMVYNLALERDLATLRELQAQGHCLTQLHHSFHHEFNAIAKLAFDGHGDAAEFLVDYLIGNPHDLVMGYAHAGNVERTLFWTLDTESRLTAFIGLAYAGNIHAVENLLGNDLEMDRCYHYYALLGFAKGKHHDLVERFSNTEFTTQKVPHYRMNRERIIEYSIKGYALAGDTKGLELAGDNHELLDEYYRHTSILTPLDTIPENFQHFHLYNAAKLDDNETLLRYESILREDLYFIIEHNYYHGGHSPHEALAVIISPATVIECLMSVYCRGKSNPRHPSLTTRFLSDPSKDRKLANKNPHGENSYYGVSPYGVMSTLLSTDPSTQIRELLQISDVAKRQRLHWVTTTKLEKMEPYMTDKYEKICRIDQIFKRTGLGFIRSMALGQSQQHLLAAINLILVSLHQSAGALNTSLVVDLILSNLLRVTETDAVKIHSHFAGMFSKHINRLSNPQNTLTQGNKTHAPQHPSAGL